MPNVKPDESADAGENLIASALRTLEIEAGGIKALSEAIKDGLGGPMVVAVAMIRAARGRMIVTGMGKAGHIARKIAATFASTGTPAYFVHPGEASHGDLGMITPDDVIMALSWSGETVELKDLINYSRRFRINLIAITASRERRPASLVLPQVREACPHNLAPRRLADAAGARRRDRRCSKSRGFTFDFRAFIRAESWVPCSASYATSCRRRRRCRSSARRGRKRNPADVAARRRLCGRLRRITDHDGRLVGIITDGTCAEPKAQSPELTVDTIMTRDPKTARPDQLVSEAMELINASKISVLIVVEDARPVGIVHFHDLLRAGVA